MNLFIDLFGNLVIAVLTFIPIISSSLLAIFHDGIKILVNQNENEINQTEKNIKKQVSISLKKHAKLDEKMIMKTLTTLKNIKKKASKKLCLLNIKLQTILITIPLILSFIFIQISALKIENYFIFKNSSFKISHSVPCLIIALILFCFAIYKIWKILEIIEEVKKASDEEKDKVKNAKFDRLVEVLEKLGDKNFVKKFSLKINDIDLNTTSPTTSIKYQEINNFKIVLDINEIDKIVKNLEVGLIFPNSFLIEKNGYDSLTNTVESQIIRFKRDLIQSNTAETLGKLKITPLEKGSFNIQAFVKAENIVAKYQNIKIVIN